MTHAPLKVGDMIHIQRGAISGAVPHWQGEAFKGEPKQGKSGNQNVRLRDPDGNRIELMPNLTGLSTGSGFKSYF
jgi:hypothetical protein